MTPQEKAKQLVWEYSRALQIWDLENSLIAIKCALIAVDEIIETFIPKHNRNYLCEEIAYWNEVKQEILKL